MRIGFGYDVHRLEENLELMIGGIRIKSDKGALGHSDADVLLHSICDALLGAASLRDIGYHFPDTDIKYKGIDSKLLLAEVFNLISDKGYKVCNLDATVCLQSPKLSSYIPEMQKVISNILQIKEIDVSIKATTTEKLGFVGNESGISSYCVCLIENIIK